jgi:SAM-dependent methyltransferase
MKLFLFIKKILFPGLDISTRKRMKFAKYFKAGDILTLDAGCGNGAFSFEAAKLGNRVVGIDFDPKKLKRCEEFRDYLKIDSLRCQFKIFNIYDLPDLKEFFGEFDQIICFETLEHLKNDQKIISLFNQVLKPGGALHLGVPNADRKPYYGEIISQEENGGHLRLGYFLNDLEKIFKREGFALIRKDSAVGFFGKILVNINQWISLSPLTKNIPDRIKDILNIAVLITIYPITFLDVVIPSKPLNIYVMAIKSK